MDPLSRLKSVELLLLDVDGVLTGGEIIYTDHGEQIKQFNVKDGVGIRMLKKAGIEVGIITGRSAAALRHRCENLGIDMVFNGVRDKVKVLEQIIKQNQVALTAIGFVGDDLPDLAILKRVGLAVAVADAHELIRQTAHIITTAPGGRGAVREISEMILKAQGKWEHLIERLFGA
jgi:3-deoxy-D-manno-octulosonate 8-phosphate phosphatase (KDO 8-P phosphatase)